MLFRNFCDKRALEIRNKELLDKTFTVKDITVRFKTTK